jgi:hypothetical protein
MGAQEAPYSSLINGPPGIAGDEGGYHLDDHLSHSRVAPTAAGRDQLGPEVLASNECEELVGATWGSAIAEWHLRVRGLAWICYG